MKGGGGEQGQGQDEGGSGWRGGLEAPAFALHERGLALLDSRERVPLVHLGEQPGERAASRTRGTAEGVARAEEGPVDRQAERGVQLCPLCPLRLQALPRAPRTTRAYSARTARRIAVRSKECKDVTSALRFPQAVTFSYLHSYSLTNQVPRDLNRHFQ